MAIVTGIFLALLTNYFLATVAGGAAEELWFGLAAWRWMFMVEVIPAVLYGVLALTIPESPRYLVSRGEEKTAREVLARVMRTGISERIAEIKRTVSIEARSSVQDLIDRAVAGCCRLSGSASGSRSCSSSSGSTSSSTTLRRCGSRSASPSRTRWRRR